MKMKEASERFDKLLQLSSLHGWCNEVDEELSFIHSNIDKDISTDFIEFLLKVLSAGKKKKNEYIISIVLLYMVGYSAHDLTDKLFSTLSDKIFEEDLNFIMSHLFHGHHPFSNEITNNLVKRVFFSYRRAINEAFNINSIIADIPADEAVLYLTILLCNKGLNDQNRAMVYFLLSRIDIDLPKSVFNQTMNYINKLGDLILEVEQAHESALKKTIDFRNELDTREANTYVDEKEYDNKDEVVDSEDVHTEAIDNKVDPTEISNSPIATKQAENSTDVNQVEVKETELKKLNNEDQESSSNTTPNVNKETQEISNERLNKGMVTSDSPETTSSITAEPQKADENIDAENTNPQPTTSSENKKVVSEETATDQTEAQKKEEIEKYKITFSKNLEEILELAKKHAEKNKDNTATINSKGKSMKKEKQKQDTPEVDETLVNNKPDAIKDETTKEKAVRVKKKMPSISNLFKAPVFNKLKNKAKALLKDKRFVAIPIVILLIVGLTLLLRNVSGSRPPTPEIVTPEIVTPEIVTPEIVTPEIVTPEIVTPEIVSPEIVSPEIVSPEIVSPEIVTPEIVTPEIVTPEIVTPEATGRVSYTGNNGLNFNFIISGSKITWEVDTLNSFWNLYAFLSSPSFTGNKTLKELGNTPWIPFLNSMKQLNPDKEITDLIFSNDRFIIKE